VTEAEALEARRAAIAAEKDAAAALRAAERAVVEARAAHAAAQRAAEAAELDLTDVMYQRAPRARAREEKAR
jgi:hypothetical protein